MTLEFSLLSKYKSLVGIVVERHGKMLKDNDGKPLFQSTVVISLGFLFGYLSLHFDLGAAIAMDDMITRYKDTL